MSVLHATKYTKFYQKLGWIPIPRYFITIDCRYLLNDTLKLKKSNDFSYNCLPIKELFFSSNVTLRDAVFKMHDNYNKQFFGPIKRSESYWSSWVGNINKNCYLLMQNNELISYMILEYDSESNTIKLKDFASNGFIISFDLLHYYMEQLNLVNPKFKVPLPILSQFISESVIADEKYNLDFENGFHYLNLNDKLLTLPSAIIEPWKSTHLFWDVDAY